MSANKPLNDPSDANGLKFRVQNSEVLKAQMAALGGSPQPMAFSEVYCAANRRCRWAGKYLVKHLRQKVFEVQDGQPKPITVSSDYLLVTSTDWWDGLDGEIRDQLSTIIAEVTEARNSESTAVNEAAKQEIIAAGGVVRQLSAAQRENWVATMKPVWSNSAVMLGKTILKQLKRLTPSIDRRRFEKDLAHNQLGQKFRARIIKRAVSWPN